MYLPTDLQQFVGEQMALGHYETFDDLVADALTAFRDKQRAELLEQIDIGRGRLRTVNARSFRRKRKFMSSSRRSSRDEVVIDRNL